MLETEDFLYVSKEELDHNPLGQYIQVLISVLTVTK
jgi:hypothetical protein